MSEVKDFFRHCPACGRRFHIKLVSEKFVDERKETTNIKKTMNYPTPMTGFTPFQVILQENTPIVVDIKDFQYSYKCKHCGHEWSEMRMTESKA
jgi:hypothetical protein